MNCIATFYSHFGAIRFKKALTAQGIPARTMPVPRALSSSCGTCVAFTAAEGFLPEEELSAYEELEQIAGEKDGCYTVIYAAQD